MEGIGRGGAKSFDAGMSGCQDVRMSGCQNVRMSECQNVRVSAMTEARSGAGGRASGCRRGGAHDGGKSVSELLTGAAARAPPA